MLTVFDQQLLKDYEQYKKKKNSKDEEDFKLDNCFFKQKEFYKKKWREENEHK